MTLDTRVVTCFGWGYKLERQVLFSLSLSLSRVEVFSCDRARSRRLSRASILARGLVLLRRVRISMVS